MYYAKEFLPPKAAVIMTKNLLAAELARILPHAEYVEMPFMIPMDDQPLSSGAMKS